MTSPREQKSADPHAADRHDAALEQYRRRAPYYDLELALFEPVRRDAINRLAPQPGAVVLDVGCGTGLSFASLLELIGPQGRIIGIEQSPEMLERASRRVHENGWSNVTLIESAAESVDIAQGGRTRGKRAVEKRAVEQQADAALFHFTHDILREPRAVANVLAQLRPGGRVVACGLQWTSLWAWPLNVFVLGAALHSVSSLRGLERPWSHLAEHVDDLRVDSAVAGAIYIASGTVRA